MAFLVPFGLVSAETYAEYDRWEDRPAGILETLFALRYADLQDIPDWPCAHDPNALEAPTIDLVWIGDHREPALAHTDWSAELAARLAIPFTIDGPRPIADADAAYDYARAHPDRIVVGLTEESYRGPELNERLEGFQCANLALITAHVDCAPSIVAHEVGHVVGLEHAPHGLMRSRAVTCDDRLDALNAERIRAWYDERRPTAPLVPDLPAGEANADEAESPAAPA